MSELTSRLDLPLGAGAPGRARHAVTAVLQAWGFRDEAWLGAAAVLVSELVTNAIRHGARLVELTVESRARRVRLSVADGTVVPRPRDDPDGDRRLALIAALSTRWGVRDDAGGKRVWVELST